MNKLKEFLELNKQRKELNEELAPLQAKMGELNDKIANLNDSLTFSREKEFISQKLWDAFDSDTKEALQYLRKKRDEEIKSGAFSYSAYKTPFDPFYDSWYIVSHEIDGDKIRFEVSCRKNEGTISGLMTFLDVYWTTWFDISELENI